MKIRQATLNLMLLLLGILTFLYLVQSLLKNYAWTIWGGFGGLYILIPITVLSSLGCLLGALIYFIILVSTKKENKLIWFVSVIQIVLGVVWLVFLQGLGFVMENDFKRSFYEHLKGVEFDTKTCTATILPRAKWKNSNQQIFYILNDNARLSSEGTLYCLDARSKQPRRIIDNCKQFGWLPNGKDMFAFCDDSLYLLKNGGEHSEKILTFKYYYHEYGLASMLKQYYLSLNSIQWSPDGTKFAFAENDRDTDGDGKIIGWSDSPGIYIFDVTTKSKQKITSNEQNGFFERCLWDKSGNALYFVFKVYSSNDGRYNLYSFDLNRQDIKQIKEVSVQEGAGHMIEDYVGKANLSFTQKYYAIDLWWK